MSKKALSFMKSILQMNAADRLSSEQCLDHAYFDDVRAAEVRPASTDRAYRKAHSSQSHGLFWREALTCVRFARVLPIMCTLHPP